MFNDFLEFEIYSFDEYSLKVYSLLIILLIFVLTKFIIWLIKKALYRKKRFLKSETANTYALLQIIKYALWVIAFGLMLETVHVKVTVLIAGSAALLVGIGLGLQQTFNDIISGIILLTEGSTRIGDVLEIENDVVTVLNIGLRTSKVVNRDDIIIIVPNSLITTNKVINWSHQSKKTRFKINVGVAYGSDIDLVVKVLEESVLEHPEISDKKSIEARFVDFGDSSLDFQVLFFDENVFRIEKIKSDIRKIINHKFIENRITIPFPQRDLHIKSGSV